jgi:hypothetical protein
MGTGIKALTGILVIVMISTVVTAYLYVCKY